MVYITGLNQCQTASIDKCKESNNQFIVSEKKKQRQSFGWCHRAGLRSCGSSRGRLLNYALPTGPRMRDLEIKGDPEHPDDEKDSYSDGTRN